MEWRVEYLGSFSRRCLSAARAVNVVRKDRCGHWRGAYGSMREAAAAGGARGTVRQCIVDVIRPLPLELLFEFRFDRLDAAVLPTEFDLDIGKGEAVL